MMLIRRLTMLLALALGASALPAQDEGSGNAQPAEEAAAADPAPESPAEAGEEPASDDEPEAPRSPQEDDVFVPTEEIDADEEVVFPVDI